MKKNKLIASLKQNYDAFINFVDSLSNESYDYSVAGKWSAGLHTAHLMLSVKPLVYVFELDKTSIVEKFGNTTKIGCTYTEMKNLYFEKLKDGGKAPERFVPDIAAARPKTELAQKLRVLIDQLCISIDRFSEEELDSFCVPHPLLGSLSLREMLYNAIYHAEHHQNLVLKMINRKFEKTS
ncbi:DinB family protein [Maribacter algarum]|uniref:DinB family protein n=1 Tax=Maribacter algarum (ex Zhang et al. 2020) TaxID=2578118 RepID=A0A5S3PXR6_9FLAO|nr:DinB family protein [Maribacter algarum]TMM58067.1 DinB family protein [Maribacter algarum]